ncbi:uncharacterized protein EI90DRAFT_3036112 [Cantharellus anzutake]|uniref:uncharacterized protein n=1 Tax=Cantharellus anzutake TaxID=1750568 RepID=UPI0019065ECA|nr:uncharacterized protein EI90DRAFT_3036112 [Cantharellus anzutake]KAF8340594.1 hypothetical protein EI90DRAFT_3036112 [Cantharellus anzutake]
MMGVVREIKSPILSLGSPQIVILCGVTVTVSDDLDHWNSSDGASGMNVIPNLR